MMYFCRKGHVQRAIQEGMFAVLLGFITAFVLTYTVIPVIIRVAMEKRLYDKPNERSSHDLPTPALGGIGIFAGTVCGIVLWTPLNSFGVLQYILAAFIIIFLVGVMDDLMPIRPMTKMMGQLLVAIILAYKAQIQIVSLHGVLDVYELPEVAAFLISLLAIIGIINAFNLIDGINGLAGSVGLLAGGFWGVWFVASGHPAFGVLGFSLAGALTGFLKYNFTPARIFMGDTGSLLTGTVCAILAIKFIEVNYLPTTPQEVFFHSAPAIAVSVLILPLFDTLRVFTHRIMKGHSPFYADRNHIHHLLLDAGLSHMNATFILMGINVLFIVLANIFSELGTSWLLLIMSVIASILSTFLSRFVRKRTYTQLFFQDSEHTQHTRYH
ncbi:MAG: undecaprenyl/decaprenyl-phosphate alpha-N-acetylglucosaminyl 1-phosphate transferase, partial [Saprospiraceae bacterium]|nr:undecaprenyl/decaprenyl-phosphate alpha-N-acetylglucosaminyl 1-phosphate transferase [Saprospiraceae bacterium]